MVLDRLSSALGLTTPSHRSHNYSDYDPIESPVDGRSRASTLTGSELVGSPIGRRSSFHTRQRSSSRVSSIISEADESIRRAHYILGAATLLPWNAIITATPYFLSRLEGSGLKNTFGSYLSSTYNLSGFLALWYATATANMNDFSLTIRSSSFVLVLLLLLMSISPVFSLSPGIFFVFVISNGVLQAIAGALLQTSVVALAALFGPYAIQAVFAGQAAVGVLVSAVQYITTAIALAAKRKGAEQSPGESERHTSMSAFVFFAASTAFIVLTIAVHSWLVTLPVYKEVVKPFEAAKAGFIVEEEEEDISDQPGPEQAEVTDEERHLIGVQVQVGDRVSAIKVAKMNWMYNVAVAYVFIVTLAVFPPITSSIQSVDPDQSSYFGTLFNALHFLVFNVGDYLGRYLCTFPSLMIWSRKRLLGLSLARTMFIPLFLACNIQRSDTTSPLATPPLINSDVLYILILLSFGISNGYSSTTCMMAAPSLEHNPKMRKDLVDTAATVAQFSLVGGLFLGSFASFGVRAAICDCDPFSS
ncbi:hypothetical protein FRC02_005878 [Tulasnella sp. 418]|nr:hypothetical protein FRC02_005878 [Tulasnella sp. 418]